MSFFNEEKNLFFPKHYLIVEKGEIFTSFSEK